jgi:DNA-binding response OmpR family regulator
MEMFEGRNVLILEDELLIASALDDVLAELGCQTQLARRVQQAMTLLEDHYFDAAFLDMNLDGELSLPVAQALARRSTPYAFMSGYSSTEVREIFGDAPILRKPFSEGEVVQMLRALFRPPNVNARPIGVSDTPQSSAQ